ncbi:MAG: LacI family DNA-binding transcriptional regulator [Niastella sp.]|nr:LacI family DNA-binding transcriptional regulator [Niastella sp.]
MMQRPPTIKDLARALNISVSTVSRALRNATDINPETRQAVLKLAKEMEYEPNFIAQSLVKKQTHIIGVVVPSIDSNYFSEALSGMTDCAIEQNYHLMICQSNENEVLENKSIRKLLSCNIDGLLISVSLQTKSDNVIKEAQKKHVPVVMFDRIIPGADCTKVIVNEYEGALKAVEHLIKKGCKRIAHIGGPKDLSVSENRKKGYLDALAKHKIPVREELIAHCKSFEEDAIGAIRKVMNAKPRPDAIFFINDLSAITAIEYIRRKGLRIPEDIKIVGFNNDKVSNVVEPALTTVMQPGYEVGKLALGVLIDEIESKSTERQLFELRTTLVTRKSSR